MGLLNSAHECNRPSLLDFLFSDPPLPAAIVVVIVVIVVFIEDPTYHLVFQVTPKSGELRLCAAGALQCDATMLRALQATLQCYRIIIINFSEATLQLH